MIPEKYGLMLILFPVMVAIFDSWSR